MEFFRALFHNRILIAAVLAWAAAQVIKTILHGVINHGIDWSRLVGDGGMPSAHSATVTSAAASCGVVYGLDSGLFALALLLAFITCHDAMNSRREIGKHGEVLRELAKEQNIDPEVVLKEFVGHTPFQVTVGILLGLAIGLAVSLA